jgi:hypothetical protein
VVTVIVRFALFALRDMWIIQVSGRLAARWCA